MSVSLAVRSKYQKRGQFHGLWCPIVVSIEYISRKATCTCSSQDPHRETISFTLQSVTNGFGTSSGSALSFEFRNNN